MRGPVWVWQNPQRREERLAIGECPVSYVSGESLAMVEDYYAQEAVGAKENLLKWPARRVEAFLTLAAEGGKGRG